MRLQEEFARYVAAGEEKRKATLHSLRVVVPAAAAARTRKEEEASKLRRDKEKAVDGYIESSRRGWEKEQVQRKERQQEFAARKHERMVLKEEMSKAERDWQTTQASALQDFRRLNSVEKANHVRCTTHGIPHRSLTYPNMLLMHVSYVRLVR
jgi:hypothetical protein